MKKISYLIKYFLGKEQIRNFDNLKKEKIYLIDYLCQNNKIESFADLGGVWGVNGGYTFYGMRHYRIKTAFLVDTDVFRKSLRSLV